jgi:excisionase family DNA binding protein
MATAETTTGPVLLFTVNEAAAFIGCSKSTLLKWDARGLVPAPLRPGGMRIVRWRKAELEEWIRAGCPNRRTWEAMRQGAAG